MSKMKISIIVPVYNVEKYLEQCVESIVCQDYENKEIILVNDGSTDSSPALCDKLAEKYNIVTVIHKENGGLSDARNTGLTKATGDYVLFIDSDDFIENDSLSKICEVANNALADVVFLEAVKFLPDGTRIPLGDGITKEGVHKKTKAEVLDFISGCPKYPASACTKLIKRTLFDNKELMFEKGIFCEDLDWALKLILAAESFDYCNVPYYNYRQSREGSITNTMSCKKMDDMLYIAEKWCEIAKTKDDNTKKFIFSLMSYELPIIIHSYGKLYPQDKSQFKDRIKKLSFLFAYRNGLKYKGTRIIYTLFGIDVTSKFIELFQKIKK